MGQQKPREMLIRQILTDQLMQLPIIISPLCLPPPQEGEMPVVSAGGQRGTERDRGGEGDLSGAVVVLRFFIRN